MLDFSLLSETTNKEKMEDSVLVDQTSSLSKLTYFTEVDYVIVHSISQSYTSVCLNVCMYVRMYFTPIILGLLSRSRTNQSVAL